MIAHYVDMDACPCITCVNEKVCMPMTDGCGKYDKWFEGVNVARVAEEICDGYCKYPDEYRERYKDPDEAQERMAIERCENCPLNKIV